jgi:radical SAM superfamily enzyme YgiQ (UPF0313 family)
MPSRILLISTNTFTTPDPVFPLGVACVAAALRRAGHHVHVLDMLANPEPLPQVLNKVAPSVVGISLRNIDDVLIRKREVFFGSLQELCSTVRSVANCKIVLGGSGYSIFPRELLEFSTADYGIQGEGEGPLLALIEALEKGGEIRAVPGLVYKAQGRVLCNPHSPMGAERGFASEEGVDFASDELAPYYLRNGGMLNVQTQRGCAHHCCYCTYPVIEGHRGRPRAPERVADSFEQALKAGAKYLFIVDSIFNSSGKHVRQICEAILDRGVQIPWGCFLRPQGLTQELMRLMSRAGLRHVEFGSDSFSDRVLQAYDKRLTFSDIEHSSHLAHEAGIDYCHFLICGGPGETMDTLRESFEQSRKLPGAVIMATVGMRIYPGTDLCRLALEEGRITAGSDLLRPSYYLANGLESEQVFSLLKDIARMNPAWITGDTTPEYIRLVERLRGRGVAGPLWSYVAMIQRLWPAATADEPADGGADKSLCASTK